VSQARQGTFIPTLVSGLILLVGVNFAFEAIQGDYGLFARLDAEIEVERLRNEYAALTAEITAMENLTLRLSDTYLDLDLLDQQARSVLGMVRHDELVLR